MLATISDDAFPATSVPILAEKSVVENLRRRRRPTRDRARIEPALPREDRDAFVPGEGAAFLLLASRPLDPATPLAIIYPPGVGIENGHRASREPHLGDGLADAVRSALERAGCVGRSVCTGLNGENFLAKEWGVAWIRNQDRLDPAAKIDHPAESYGDLGPASGLAMAAIAAIEISRGLRESPALLWCASEGSLRAAAVLAQCNTRSR